MKKVFLVALVGILILGLVACSSIEMFEKDMEAQDGGINRIVNIYSVTGDIIASYTGKIYVEFNKSGRMSMMLNDKRYQYFGAIVEIIEL